MSHLLRRRVDLSRRPSDCKALACSKPRWPTLALRSLASTWVMDMRVLGPLLKTALDSPTIWCQGLPRWAQYIWQQRQSMSVWCWFQDHADLRLVSPCLMHPQPHSSFCSYFSISLSCRSIWRQGNREIARFSCLVGQFEDRAIEKLLHHKLWV